MRARLLIMRTTSLSTILNTVVRTAVTATATTTGVSNGAFLFAHHHNPPTTALSLRAASLISSFGVLRPYIAATGSGEATAIYKRKSRMMFSSLSDSQDKSQTNHANESSSGRPLEAICMATLQACEAVTPAIEAFYRSINNDKEKKTTKTKADESVFTIADGLVQFLFAEIFLGQRAVGDIVGEEDCPVNLDKKPYSIDDLVVPSEFEDVIDKSIEGVKKARDGLLSKSDDTSNGRYQSLTAFIDPIDGTREFSTQKGEQCTICVGFADIETGKPVAGVVYRPLSHPSPTWAAGAKDEEFASSSLIAIDSSSQKSEKGSLLTTNGRISPFTESLMKELDYGRVPSGGAGNKMLMLLEGAGTAYIQDRGVSRWDTCGAQAVLEAHGGILCKLDRFLESDDESSSSSSMSYTYRKTDQNLDFVPGMARLTKYNAAKGVEVSEVMAMTPAEVKPYANLCGLVALGKPNSNEVSKAKILDGLKKAATISPPAFD